MAYINEKARFVEWLKLGTREARKAAGLPETVMEYAEKTGINRVTLQRWKIDPDVKRAVVDHGVTMFTVDEIRAARDKLVEKALEGNTTAIKMMLDLAGVSSKNAGDVPQVSVNELSALSDEELEARLAEEDE